MDLAAIEAAGQAGDRRCTAALLEALPTATGERLNAVVDALVRLEDPRADGPLQTLVDEETLPAEVRRGAARALFDGLRPPTDPWLQAGFQAGGLRAELAASHAGPAHAACVLAWLEATSDRSRAPSRDWDGHASAGFAALRAAAIPHADGAHRAWAVQEAYWNEPHDLLDALIDVLHDPDPELAANAAEALAYHPGLRTWRALRDFARGDDARTALQSARDEVGDTLARALHRQPALRAWIDPVAEALPSPEPTQPVAPFSRPERAWVDLAALARRLDDPDGPPPGLSAMPMLEAPPAAQLAAMPGPDRTGWVRRLSAHPDPWFRELAAWWCVACADLEGVEVLLADAHPWVRQVAVYCAGGLPPDPGLAEALWQAVCAPDCANSRMREAVASWLVHAPQNPLRQQRLRALRDGTSLTGRCVALRALGASGDLDGVAPCWTPRPGESVAEVAAWLDALSAAGLPVDPPAETRALDVLWVRAAWMR